MTPAYLIPADLARDMDALAAHIAAGRFEAVLHGLLADPGGAAASSVRARIVAAIRGQGSPPRCFADDAAGIAGRLHSLDARARAVAVFMLLPCAGNCAPRAATESDFAFTVRLFGSHGLVWRVAGGAGIAQLPGLDAVLDVGADPLVAARRYLDAVPRAAAWLGWFAAGGAHPDVVTVREPWVVGVARWFGRGRARAAVGV